MNVIIVGAGPAGVTTAYLLVRSGVEVTLVERETSFHRVFRGEAVMPSGMDALRQMGLLDQILAATPNQLIHDWRIFLDGEEALRVPEPLDELGPLAPRVISQPGLLETVVKAAGAFPTFTFRAGARVTGLLRDAAGRFEGVTVDEGGSASELRASLVIGSDGRGSVVRTFAGLRLDLFHEQYDVLWFTLPAPPELDGPCSVFILVAGRANPVIAYVGPEGRLRYGLVVPKGSAAARPGYDWFEDIVKPAPPWLADFIRAHRDGLDGPTRLNVMVGRCLQWAVPGLLLLGDAAHPMSPVRAQGINHAFRDAIVTANQLAMLLKNGASHAALDGAARAVQQERDPEIIQTQKLQQLEAAGERDARDDTWRFRLGKRLLPALGRYQWVQRAWLWRQRGLRFGTKRLRLTIPLDKTRPNGGGTESH